MAIVELYSGTEAVGATEHYLTSDTTSVGAVTTDGVYQLFLDLNDMVATDILRIRIFEKCRSGDSQRVIAEWILRDAQSTPSWVSPSFILMHGWDMSATALTGTITVLWSIRQVA